MEEQKRRPTSVDVAKLAGVAQSTVSYVINNRTDGNVKVSEETRQRVMKAVSELGYYPSAAGRNLRAKKTSTIALIMFNYTLENLIAEPFLSGVMSGLVEYLSEQEYYLLILPVPKGVDRSVEAFLHSNRADGVVISDPALSAEAVAVLKAAPLPVVFVDGQICDDPLDFPNVNGLGHIGSRMITEYLWSKGHRRIGHIQGPLSTPSAHSRRAGYVQVMQEHGSYSPSLIAEGDWFKGGGYKAAHQLLGLTEPPSAIYAANDQMAIGAIEAAHALGLRVPEDVAIAGYDDIPVAADVAPALTTVRFPFRTIGRQAGEMVLKLATDSSFKPAALAPIPVEIIERASA
jgi:DNA-binding LacI/PurR family transcriptional regulator